MYNFDLPVVEFTEEQNNFRQEVRAFLQKEKDKGTYETRCDSWLNGFNPEFSRKLGEKGWIGITWPKKYGGAERSAIDRYIVIEELLAAGAPVARTLDCRPSIRSSTFKVRYRGTEKLLFTENCER